MADELTLEIELKTQIEKKFGSINRELKGILKGVGLFQNSLNRIDAILNKHILKVGQLSRAYATLNQRIAGTNLLASRTRFYNGGGGGVATVINGGSDSFVDELAGNALLRSALVKRTPVPKKISKTAPKTETVFIKPPTDVTPVIQNFMRRYAWGNPDGFSRDRKLRYDDGGFFAPEYYLGTDRDAIRNARRHMISRDLFGRNSSWSQRREAIGALGDYMHLGICGVSVH